MIDLQKLKRVVAVGGEQASFSGRGGAALARLSLGGGQQKQLVEI